MVRRASHLSGAGGRGGRAAAPRPSCAGCDNGDASREAGAAPGLEPKEVADLFYASLRERDADTFLATLAQPLKDTPGVGAFAAKECGWDAGVAKVRKYDCRWFFSPHGGKQFKSHLGEGGRSLRDVRPQVRGDVR